MSENAPPPPPPMQFDVAQYPETGPAASACSACNRPLVQTYYTANQAIICPECMQQLSQQLTGGSGIARFFAALGLGIVAGIAGALLWFIIRKVTGWQIGLVAIVVGLAVGLAVRKGSGGRGGWQYQLMAVLITYLSVCIQWVPDMVQGVLDQAYDDVPAVVQTAGDDGSAPQDAESEPRTGAPASATPSQAPHRPSRLGMAVMATILVIPYSLKVPLMGGIIGILIVGFALYEAWKMNKRQSVQMAGPFQLAAPPPAPAPNA